MEDFFKDRPVVPPAKDTVFVGGQGSSGSPPSPSGSSGGFVSLQRHEVAPSGSPAGAGKAMAPMRAAENQDLKTEHGARVQTIVERGRVTRIVVTCSCGKVTEIDCLY